VPIYEYVCHDCSYKFELKQSIKDDPTAACSKCGKSVNRIISSPAIMFKGSGWYITDYSDKMKPPAEKAKDGSSGPASEAKAPASETSKPAASPAVSTTPPATPPPSGSASSSGTSSGSTS